MIEGANTALAGPKLTARVSGPVDLIALIVGSDGKVVSDADMVFFNQPTAPGVRLEGRTLHLDLARLRPGADRVVLVASPEQDGATFDGLNLAVVIKHGHPRNGEPTGTGAGEDVHFAPARLTTQAVAVLAEVYQRAGAWKVRAVGQGYDSGLAGLARDFGVDVDDSNDDRVDDPNDDPADEAAIRGTYGGTRGDVAATVPSPTVASATSPAASPAASLSVAGALPAQLTKPALGAVSLHKAQRVSFTKAAQTRITASLKWTRRKDLDLYALYIDTNDHEGVCYYRKQGDLNQPPYLSLVTGDTREPGLETIEIARPDALRHVLICAYSAVENGFGSFKSFGAHVEVTDHAGSVVTTPLYHRNAFAYWVAIAHIDLSSPDEVAIAHVETYSKGGSERRPLLHPDGTFEMNKGPVEFKSPRLQRLADRQDRQIP
ncbi:TerD family protein [Kineococcus sp. SYSU DK003]|uniref:TerD family protein n=1 Tax=Kineococcus sp. SYSU DK003 TaxID=3383124 RepID=UPI003D7C65D0